MVNILTLALTHALLAVALLRMLARPGLDPKDDPLTWRGKGSRKSRDSRQERGPGA